jgi:hypothetical protein
MERREHKRLSFWLPVLIDQIEGGFAVSHNASDGGLLLVCARELEVGTHIDIAFRVPPDGPVEVRVAATVVRITPNDEDPEGLWPYKLAVRFEQPVPELEALLERLSNPAA